MTESLLADTSEPVKTGRLKWIAAVIFVNFSVAVFATQIFSMNFPLGMDTFSHLPKVFYLAKYGVASWYFDWYGGSPLFIFYPPLSYLIGYGPIALGLDPLFSYKLVEFTALLVTPFVFYVFARKLRISQKNSLYGTLIFSLVPFTIVNSVVFGRYTNIVGYPFFLLTLISLAGLLHRFTRRGIFLTAIFFSLTLLTHHLSGYILGIVMFVYVVGFLFEKSSVRQKFVNALSVGGSFSLGILISSFWVVPFVLYLRYYGLVGIDSSVISVLPISVTVFTFLVIFLHYIVKKIFTTTDFQYRTVLVWLVLFLLLGTTAVPVDFILPFGTEVDLLRFQLFSAIPLAIYVVSIGKYPLSALRKAAKSVARIHKAYWIIVLLVLNAASGVVVYQVAPTVVAQQIYVDEPPNDLIAYLQKSEDYGRIMPISVPYWIFIMPHYTDKPLIDGWYPQGSIISPIKQVRWATDRQTLDSVNDDRIYRFFISHADELSIKWVLLGDKSRTYLFEGTTFRPILSGSDYVLLENADEVFYVTVVPQAAVDWERGNDSIAIEFEAKALTTEVKVKEAFFPGWIAIDNGDEISLSRDSYGFITFKVEGLGNHRVELVFKPYEEIVPNSLEDLQATIPPGR